MNTFFCYYACYFIEWKYFDSWMLLVLIYRFFLSSFSFCFHLHKSYMCLSPVLIQEDLFSYISLSYHHPVFSSSPLSRSSPLIWWWMKNRSISWHKDEALTWSGGVEQSWKSTIYSETQVLSNLIVSVMMKMNISGLLFVYLLTNVASKVCISTPRRKLNSSCLWL